MTLDQLNAIKARGRVSCILTTRNGIFRTVGGEGQLTESGKYEIVEWDDALELVWLRQRSVNVPGMTQPLMAIRYEIIDEMEIIPN
jgi:hypothetical protein